MVDPKKDIRWIQRFANFQKALSQLKKFIDKGELSELEDQGLIKAFEYTYEHAWSTLNQSAGNLPTHITLRRCVFKRSG
jgi:Nucleotidyltransferase substrate binding protein like